jgi:hypothetical protein
MKCWYLHVISGNFIFTVLPHKKYQHASCGNFLSEKHTTIT